MGVRELVLESVSELELEVVLAMELVPGLAAAAVVVDGKLNHLESLLALFDVLLN